MAVRHPSEKNEAICRPDYIFHLTCFAGCLDGFGECQNAEHLGRSIARKGWIVVTGGGAGGLTGIVARAVNHHGGRVYGVSLAALDPRPHDFFTEFECYQEFDARQRRLFELGDAYLALPGGIDTLHQVLHACVLNLAGPLQKPVILVGDHFLKRCDLTALLRLDGASCDRVLLYKAKSVEEAVEYAESYFAELATRRYVSPAFYPALSPDDILKHILRDTRSYDVLFERIELTVFPGVFPSHRFRASRALGALARQISTGKRILDVGCGPGAIGLVALTNGAQSVTFSDLSPAAVKNTAYNVERHGYAERTAIYEGDLFDNIPFGEKFDIIYFNPPFHMEARRDEATSSVLFGGKRQEVVAQFLSEAKQRLAPSGHILMCFSNKDPGSLNAIERMFEQYEYRSELLVHRDASTGADVRIYRLCGQQRSRVGSGRIEPAAL